MKLTIEGTPEERRRRAGWALRQLAKSLAPESDLAKAILEELDHLEVPKKEKLPLPYPALRALVARARQEYRNQLAGALRAILFAYEVGSTTHLRKALGPSDLEILEGIIRRRHAAAAFRVYGPSALTAEEIQTLRRAGLSRLTRGSFQALELAFRMGKNLVPETPDAPQKPPPLSTVVTEYRTDDPPLGAIERESIRIASERAGEYIREIGEEAAAMVREEVAAAIEERKTPKELRSALRARTADFERDWDRVANTELWNSTQAGQAEVIRARAGDGARVYKIPASNACGYCLALHLEDGIPRVFLLSDLVANGTNVGRKKPEWRAVVGPTHPHCFSAGTLIATPTGQAPIESLRPGDRILAADGSEQAVTHAWVNWFEGELFSLETADGARLETTPNHPLLSGGVWREASTLELGSDLVRVLANVDAPALFELEAKHRPIELPQNPRFVRILTFLSGTGVPIPAVDLDGQFYLWKSEINVDGPNGKRDFGAIAALVQRFIEQPFIGRIEFSGALLCAQDLFFERVDPPPGGFVCGTYYVLSGFGTTLGPHNALGATNASLLDTDRVETSQNSGTANIEPDRYLLHGEQFCEMEPRALASGNVRTVGPSSHRHTVLAHILRRQVAQPVFNLSVTGPHTYIANGIVCHNCACTLHHLPEGWGLDEDGDAVPIEKAIPVWFEPSHDGSKAYPEAAANLLANVPTRKPPSPVRTLLDDLENAPKRPVILEVVPMLSAGEVKPHEPPEVPEADPEERKKRRKLARARKRQLDPPKDPIPLDPMAAVIPSASRD